VQYGTAGAAFPAERGWQHVVSAWHWERSNQRSENRSALNEMWAAGQRPAVHIGRRRRPNDDLPGPRRPQHGGATFLFHKDSFTITRSRTIPAKVSYLKMARPPATPCTTFLSDNILDAQAEVDSVHSPTEDHPPRNRTTRLAATTGPRHDTTVLSPRRIPGGHGLDR